MTVPKVRTVNTDHGRLYEHPAGAGEVPLVPGVTSVISIMNKPALVGWAAKMAGLAALNERHIYDKWPFEKQRLWISNAHRRDSQGKAGLGTAVHETIDRVVRREITPAQAPAAHKPYLHWYGKYLNEYNVKVIHSEVSVWSHKHGYAGTLDGIHLWQGEETLNIVDTKTGESGIWPEAALQQSAYAHADVLIVDGQEIPMPKIDSTAALWLRPEGFSLVPLDNSAQTFQAFLSLLDVYRWDKEIGKKAVKPAINENPLTPRSF